MTALPLGLAEPAHDAQRLFRTILDAFAHPGRVVELRNAPSGPGTLCPATVAFLVTLTDRDTPLWLEDGLNNLEVRNFLRFHAGTSVIDQRDAAAFAVVAGKRVASFDGFAIGTDLYPDRAATLVIEVSAFDVGPARRWRGPGIDGTARVAIAGVTGDFWNAWAVNHALFPCGIDVVFTAGSRLLALPRSIAVES